MSNQESNQENMRETRLSSKGVPRVRKPKLTDPRLIIGTVLVVGSVALGAWAMEEARANEPVYVAATTLTPGTVLTHSNLTVAEARLLGQANLYLIPAGELTQEYVLTHTVAAGEFVPLSALSAQDTQDHRVIAIPVTITPPEQVAVGALVDLWHTDNSQEQVPPQLVAQNLTVSQVPDGDGMFAVSAAGQVHVVVPQQDVAAVLAAVQQPGALALLPTPGGAK